MWGGLTLKCVSVFVRVVSEVGARGFGWAKARSHRFGVLGREVRKVYENEEGPRERRSTSGSGSGSDKCSVVRGVSDMILGWLLFGRSILNDSWETGRTHFGLFENEPASFRVVRE